MDKSNGTIISRESMIFRAQKAACNTECPADITGTKTKRPYANQKRGQQQCLLTPVKYQKN